MPPKNGIRRDDGRHVCQQPTTEALTDDGETSPFVIAQLQPPAVQLRRQHAVLFTQERDHVALLSFEPGEQRRHDHMQRNHPRNLRQAMLTLIFGHYGLADCVHADRHIVRKQSDSPTVGHVRAPIKSPCAV